MHINYSTVPFLTLVRAKAKTWLGLTALMLSAVGIASAQTQETATAAFLESPDADHQVPFKAVFATQFQTNLVFPILYVTVTGQGNASHLGKTSAFTNNQQGNVLTGEGTATYTLTGANGDSVVIEFVALNTPVSPTMVTFVGTYTITGGTGRFANATGSGVMNGQAVFTTETAGVGSFSVRGTISKPNR